MLTFMTVLVNFNFLLNSNVLHILHHFQRLSGFDLIKTIKLLYIIAYKKLFSFVNFYVFDTISKPYAKVTRNLEIEPKTYEIN